MFGATAGKPVPLPSRPRRAGPVVPRWAMAVGGLWLGVVGLATWLNHIYELAITLCPFRQATGLPCATCRGTRAGLALLQGEVGAAIIYNPLVTAGLALLGVWMVLRLGLGWQPRLDMSSRGRKLAWTVGLLMFAANWAYVAVMELR